MLWVSILNFMLCSLIVMLSLWAFQKTRESVPIFIAIAFGLFAFSHLAVMGGFEDSVTSFLMTVRILGYLFMVIALAKEVAANS